MGQIVRPSMATILLRKETNGDNHKRKLSRLNIISSIKTKKNKVRGVSHEGFTTKGIIQKGICD
jgi:hypothetical protein